MIFFTFQNKPPSGSSSPKMNVNLRDIFKKPKRNETDESSCQKGPDPYELPLKEPYLAQIFDDFGVAGV